MGEVAVYHAMLQDMRTFLGLWVELMKENESLGSEVLACEENLSIYANIATQYIEGAAQGVVLLAVRDSRHVGALMWGDSGSPLRTKWVKPAVGWGTYVIPEARQHGVARALRKRALSELRRMGFKVVTGAAVEGNDPGVESGRRIPGMQLHALVGVILLDEE